MKSQGKYFSTSFTGMQIRIKRWLCLLSLVFIVYCPASAQQAEKQLKGKVLLAIFAHPDDEELVAPVLAKYAAEGVSVYLAVVTDGRLGVEPHAHIPAGDALVQVRIKEMKCAALNIGINPPILMGFHDQLDMQQGFNIETNELNAIREKIVTLFSELKPDVVITWPSGGWSGHLDHRIVGDIVTEVFAATHWNKSVNLYFPGIPLDWKLRPNDGYIFSFVDSAYLTTQIQLSKEDMAKAKAAWLCHKSQYLPATVDEAIRVVWNSKKPISYFRPFFSNRSPRKSLF